MTAEQWRPVDGWPYEVSDQGRVRSIKRVVTRSDGRKRTFQSVLLKPGVMPTGHLVVSLAKAGERWTTQVHRLVAKAFLGPRPDGLETRHLDGNPANNQLTNLAYGTHSENAQDRIVHAGPRTECRRGHPLDETNGYRRPEGGIRCRACRRLREARSRA